MIKSDQEEVGTTSNKCTSKVNYQRENAKSIFQNDDFANNISILRKSQEQKSTFQMDISEAYSSMTTASSSTELYHHTNSSFFNNSNSISAQYNKQRIPNLIFYEEESSSVISRTKSQDFTPVFNALQTKGDILKQIQIQDVCFQSCSSNLQNNSKKTQSQIDKSFIKNPIKQENTLQAFNDKQKEIKVPVCELSSLVSQEIQQLYLQQINDEMESSTLKLRRVLAEEDNGIELRIFNWLDINRIFQVDPSVKREEYYQQKREKLVQIKQIQKPLEETKQQVGSTPLGKISSSPLFNRRRQFKQTAKTTNFQEKRETEERIVCPNNNSNCFQQENLSTNQLPQLQKDNCKQNYIPNKYDNMVENQAEITANPHQKISSCLIERSNKLSLNVNYEQNRGSSIKEAFQIQDHQNNTLFKSKTFNQSSKQNSSSCFSISSIPESENKAQQEYANRKQFLI